MSYFFVWLGMLFGVIAYRLATGGSTPMAEHAAGLFFCAIALAAHALGTKYLGRGASQPAASQ